MRKFTLITLIREMRTFLWVWMGQLISRLGSQLTSFALGVWVYQRTGSATQLALIYAFSILPGSLLSPFAGAFVDRWNRRWAMILSDSGSALSTLIIVLLLITGRLEIWHLYLTNTASSLFNAIQFPAYQASVALLVPKQHLGRANGMSQLSWGIAQMLSPLLGGLLLSVIYLKGIITLDLSTFLISLVILLFVHFPKNKTHSTRATISQSLWQDVKQGWVYIYARPGLLGLLIYAAFYYFIVQAANILVTPAILAFSKAYQLGLVLSSGGIGMLIGSLIMATWGGPQRLIYGVMGFRLIGGLSIFVAGFFQSIPLWMIVAFTYFFSLSINSSCEQVIWQRKVASEIQGRVFAIRQMVVMMFQPVAFLGSGWMADNVFEPLMVEKGLLASSIGQLIGVGQGRGIALMFIIMGMIIILITAIIYRNSHILLVEDKIADAT